MKLGEDKFNKIDKMYEVSPAEATLSLVCLIKTNCKEFN